MMFPVTKEHLYKNKDKSYLVESVASLEGQYCTPMLLNVILRYADLISYHGLDIFTS